MLIEFSVENFKSIKDRVTLSMIASKDKYSEDNLIVSENFNERLLRSAVIYGANASGKTNILLAMKFMVDYISNSHNKQKGTPTQVIPFKLDKNFIKKPSSFDIIFISNGIRYSYGFSIDSKKIHDEYLYSYPNGRKRIIFERKDTNTYTFKSDVEEQKTLSSRTLENVLYLSSSTQWNYKLTSEVFEWFDNNLHVITSHDFDNFIGYTGSQFFHNEEMKSQIIDFIKGADFGIKDIVTSSTLFSESDLPVDIPADLLKTLLEDLKDKNVLEINTIHTGINENGQPENIKFEINEESSGTQKLFGLIGPLLDVLEDGNTFVVDELDSRLHPILTRTLVDMFNSPIKNPNNAQLIFNTHDTSLLSPDIVRRDQIYFTEKNQEGITNLYSLLEFSPRKDENLRKGYLSGRYGAIPFISEDSIL